MGSKVLLIADDDDMNRFVIKKFLKNDYEIIEAVNGRSALDILHTRHVDVVLLDIIMPEVDGLEVLEQMKKEPELDKVGVLVATSTKEKTERAALAVGADDIVSKPYDPVVIKKRLANILMVKEICAQREHLRSNDIDSYVADRHREFVIKIDAKADKIIKSAEIIMSNKSNGKLIEELTDEIVREAEQIKEVTQAADSGEERA